MKNRLLIIILFGFMSLTAWGQIDVKVECDNYKYMVGEAIMVKVDIGNETGMPLVFNPSYHTAELEMLVSLDRSSARVPNIVKLDREFVIMPGESVSELVDINSLLGLHYEGAYQIKARIRHDGLLFTSKGKGFDVIRGVELKYLKRSLNGYSRKVLTYSLRYMTRNKGEYVFLVVTNENTGTFYGTVRLGPIVRMMDPTIKFDEEGRMIVVHQSGRKRFTRSVIEVRRDGCEFIKQTHHKRDGSKFGK